MRGHRFLSLTCFALLASSCQSTSFQTPPLAAQACDPALAGVWQSEDEAGKPDGEMSLLIGKDCRLEVTDRSDGKIRNGESTQLATARGGGNSYAWINAGWASRRFAFKELPGDSPDAFLFRYRIQDRHLQIQMLDHKFVAHQIIDGSIRGTVRSEDNTLINRITGPAQPELLALPGLFSSDLVRFQREPAAP